MPLNVLECQVSKMVNSDTCPRPTTQTRFTVRVCAPLFDATWPNPYSCRCRSQASASAATARADPTPRAAQHGLELYSASVYTVFDTRHARSALYIYRVPRPRSSCSCHRHAASVGFPATIACAPTDTVVVRWRGSALVQAHCLGGRHTMVRPYCSLHQNPPGSEPSHKAPSAAARRAPTHCCMAARRPLRSALTARRRARRSPRSRPARPAAAPRAPPRSRTCARHLRRCTRPAGGSLWEAQAEI